MRKSTALAFGAVLAMSGTMPVAGPGDPMEFYEAANGGNCATCIWIAAEGVIEADTAEVFEDFLAANDMQEAVGLNVHLNSPGGSLIGGVLLGASIRDHQANTTVTAAHVEEVYDSGLHSVTHTPEKPAECASACVFAFAGGVSRYASETSPDAEIGFQDVGRLGVHQFYDAVALKDPSAPSFDAEDRIADQKLVAILLGFLSDMGVSAELLQLAAATDPRDMHYLTEEELRSTRIDNRMAREVTLTGYENGVAIAEIAFGRGDGDYKIELYCAGGDMNMLATIDWRGRVDEEGFDTWKYFDGVSLRDGGEVALVSEEYVNRPDGGTTGKLRFRFADPLEDLVDRKQFFFTDWSSRHANRTASALSFEIPEDFQGLHLLPRTCM